MGMFDDLVCEMDLPVDNCPVKSWQTKCLDRALDQLAIRKDGALVNTLTRREVKPDAPPAPASGDTMAWFAWKSEWWEIKIGPDRPIDFTGSVTFYNSDNDKNWWEFRAFVERGVVQKILPITTPENIS